MMTPERTDELVAQFLTLAGVATTTLAIYLIASGPWALLFIGGFAIWLGLMVL